jgi:hypothetical protein
LNPSHHREVQKESRKHRARGVTGDDRRTIPAERLTRKIDGNGSAHP